VLNKDNDIKCFNTLTTTKDVKNELSKVLDRSVSGGTNAVKSEIAGFNFEKSTQNTVNFKIGGSAMINRLSVDNKYDQNVEAIEALGQKCYSDLHNILKTNNLSLIDEKDATIEANLQKPITENLLCLKFITAFTGQSFTKDSIDKLFTAEGKTPISKPDHAKLFSDFYTQIMADHDGNLYGDICNAEDNVLLTGEGA
jgi:hypothetical protein